MNKFNGPDYIPDRDDKRLSKQLERIRDFMLDGEWHSLKQIEKELKYPQASISAQLRHLRKPKHGSWRVEKKYKGEGLYLYKLLYPVEKVQQQSFLNEKSI